jgi:hypothetical protein
MPGSLVRCAIALIFLAGAGCYRPAFEDCALTCGQSALCPDDLECVAGLCRTAGHAGACPDPDGGAIVADAPPGTPDAPPGTPDAADLPDASTMCTTCDPVTQSCCEATLACDLSAAGEAFCRGVGAGSTQGIPCTVGSECARGYSCVGPDGAATTGSTTCHEFCDADGDCGGQGGLCDVRVAGTAVKACTTTCTPISQVGCQLTFACTPALAADGSRWHTDCRRVGAGSQGNACTSNEECKRNLICAGSPKRCTKVCEMGAAGGNACIGQSTCTRLGTGATFGGVEYGACL